MLNINLDMSEATPHFQTSPFGGFVHFSPELLGKKPNTVQKLAKKHHIKNTRGTSFDQDLDGAWRAFPVFFWGKKHWNIHQAEGNHSRVL
jgi:hypothetical protein